MKMINRLIPLTSGKIYVNGVDSTTVDPNELRRGIGYAIQDIGLFPHLTVAQNIATVPMLKKWPKSRQRERAAELLELVGMAPGVFIDRYPSELSGGQQQRVGVARCLGADPPVLLMDEPFGAIDPITRSRLQDEFLKIQAKLKKTIAFVTHDIDEAIKMGDKIALLRKGELEQFADPSTLLYAPKNEFVRSFVGSDHFLKGLRLHTAEEVMQEPSLTFHVNQNVSQVKDAMTQKGVRWAMVVDERQLFLGWATIDDLNTHKELRDVIEPPTVTADLTTRLNVALSMMLNSALGHLAVLHDDGRLAGVLSFQIIRDVLSEQMSAGNAVEGENR